MARWIQWKRRCLRNVVIFLPFVIHKDIDGNYVARFIQWESVVIILDAKHLWYACCVFLLSTKVEAGFLLFNRKKTQWKIQMSCWFFVYQYIWEVCDILILMEALIQWAWHNPLTASCPYKPTVTNNNTRIYNCWQSLPYLLNTQRNIFESIGF